MLIYFSPKNDMLLYNARFKQFLYIFGIKLEPSRGDREIIKLQLILLIFWICSPTC